MKFSVCMQVFGHWHNGHPCSQWFVKVVFAKYDSLDIFTAMAKDLPSNYVRIDVDMSKNRFNKFVHVKEKLEAASKFDYVLLKDKDIRLSGFERNTFFNKGRNGIYNGH